MKSNKAKTFSCWVLIVFIYTNLGIGYAQDGSYLITQHVLSQQSNYNIDFTIAKDGNTYVATKNGVIKYNGYLKELIDCKGAVLSIISDGGDVYCGGVGGFGQINSGSHATFIDLYTDPNLVIIDIEKVGEHIYGISNSKLFRFNLENGEVQQFEDLQAGHLYELFEFNNQVFVNTENKGVLQLINNQLITSDVEFFLHMDISFVDKLEGSDKYLFGTFTNEVYVYDGKFNKVENSFVQQNTISCGGWYDDDQIVLGTAFGGVAIVSLNNSEIIEMNYESGLATTDVKAIAVTRNKNIIALNDEFLELIAVNVPVKNFNQYAGIVGKTKAVSYYNSQLLIGTNRGVYVLTQVDDFAKRRVLVNKSVVHKKASAIEQKTKRSGWFRRKNETVEAKDTIVKVSEVVTRNVMVSSHYEYKPLSDIDHATQFLADTSELMIAGLSGVFAFSQTDTVQITDEPTNYIYKSNDENLLFVCHDNNVQCFQRANNKWIETEILTDFWESVSHIVEYQGYFWLCGSENIHRLEIEQNELVDAEITPISNPYFDKVYACVYKDKITFLSKSHAYWFSEKDSLLAKPNKVQGVLLSDDNKVWVKNSDKWVEQQSGIAYPIIAGLGAVEYISKTDDKVWVVSGKGEVFRFNANHQNEINTYLPSLYALDDTINNLIKETSFELSQDESHLAFQVVHPDYTHLENTQYRYRLVGLNRQWSYWTKNGLIEFSFLPPSDYLLEVEAKTSFGKVYQLAPIMFKVSPPYWQHPLFYVFEISVILLLLFISVKLRSHSRYRIISTLLAFLVLAIVIEGVEAIMQSIFNMNSSPLFSFSLQVITALTLFPFEGLLRKYILERPSSDKNQTEK